MNKVYIVLLTIFAASYIHSTDAKNNCTESKAKSCGDCVGLPGCAWCEDPVYSNNPNAVIPRCDLPQNLEKEGCPPWAISNPKSVVNETGNKAHSNVGESAVGKATQIRPQRVEAKIRPGDPARINLSFKQAEDYPVDLYYLLDLSSSMKDDLESLRKLGQKLGESMQKITRDFKLGFGSFIDKTVSPYVSTVPSKLENPCSAKEPCVSPYSFHNDLPLTSQLESFVESVKIVTHSANLDSPEGGLDAMMQAIVCKDDIKWRRDATHLLVYSTDASFHYAGDGKLGGIVFPNDGQCYLRDGKVYYKANEMDYPSIGHLVKKITENNIQPIFAVTSKVINTYTDLQKMIPKSVVGALSGNSSNIIGLIKDAYNSLKGQVILEAEYPSKVTISEEMSHCENASMPGLKCAGVKLGSVVNFTFLLSVEECLTEPVEVVVSPYGYNEKVIITVLPQCECDCNHTDVAHNCSGHGHYHCGACVCDHGFIGLDCACDQEDVKDIELYIKNCTDPETDLVCSRRGECLCGQCLCKQEDEKKIDGKYCECDNTTCDRVSTKICNDRGKCDCGQCKCNDGWTGKACGCTLDDSTCFDKTEDALNPDEPCNGNGKCMCGVCECLQDQNGAPKFRGEFCEKPVFACDVHRDCVQCIVYDTGNYNGTSCTEKCSNYTVTTLGGEEASGYIQECRFQDLTDDCSFQFYYEEVDGAIMVDVEANKGHLPSESAARRYVARITSYVLPKFLSTQEYVAKHWGLEVCQAYTDPMFIIIGIIAAIVGIGLAILLIWKLLTSIKDAREFKNFQKESQNPKWEGGENPIFKKATSTFRNPMYTAGKPSGNL